MVESALTHGQLNEAIGVKGLLVDVGKPDFELGDDHVFHMIAEPAIVQRIDYFYLQRVEGVMYRYVVFLFEI
jgi:hypothetical protein